jgi:hypothetical protein
VPRHPHFILLLLLLLRKNRAIDRPPRPVRKIPPTGLSGPECADRQSASEHRPDLGVERFPGDSARRALPMLPRGLNTEPLLESAEIADRAAYGLGLDPLDETRARRNAEMAYQAVWDTLSEWAKIAAIYRWDL